MRTIHAFVSCQGTQRLCVGKVISHLSCQVTQIPCSLSLSLCLSLSLSLSLSLCLSLSLSLFLSLLLPLSHAVSLIPHPDALSLSLSLSFSLFLSLNSVHFNSDSKLLY